MSAALAADQLRAFVERLEETNGEIDELQDVKKATYAEAKSSGFDVKALKRVVTLRAMDPAERREQDAIVTTYLEALGMTI